MTRSKTISPFAARRMAVAMVAIGVSIGCQSTDETPLEGDAPEELVLVSDRDGAELDIYLHTLGRTELTRVTSDSGSDYGPTWSPDGSRILFENDDAGNWEVFVVNADGSGRTNLTRFDGYDGGADFAPDGSEIVFTSTRDAVAEGHLGRDIWLMDPDGSNLRRLTTNDRYEGAPRFSPDGRHIAFCRSLPGDGEGESSNGEIFVMDRDGTNERRITHQEGFDCLADWSPDGARLAFHGCGEDGCTLYVVSADGGEPVKLDTEHPANWPVWSPDGEWIAYTATHDGQTDIWLIRPDGSETRQVTSHPGRDEVAEWRPRRR